MTRHSSRGRRYLAFVRFGQPDRPRVQNHHAFMYTHGAGDFEPSPGVYPCLDVKLEPVTLGLHPHHPDGGICRCQDEVVTTLAR